MKHGFLPIVKLFPLKTRGQKHFSAGAHAQASRTPEHYTWSGAGDMWSQQEARLIGAVSCEEVREHCTSGDSR